VSLTKKVKSQIFGGNIFEVSIMWPIL